MRAGSFGVPDTKLSTYKRNPRKTRVLESPEAPNGLFDRLTGWIVDLPWVTTSLLTLITAVALIGYYDASLVTDWFAVKQTERTGDFTDAAKPRPNAANRDTLNLVGDAILAIESDSFFTGQGTTALRKIVESLEAKDYVKNVLWLDEIPMPNAFSIPAPILPHATASAESFQNAKQKALDHPIIGGVFLSDDAKTLIMMVEFDFLFVQTDANCLQDLRTTAQQAVAEFSENDFEFGVTGDIPFYITARKSQGENRFFYQAIGYSMIAIMAVILFRGFAAVFVVAIAPAMGVFWTLGIIRFFDVQGNPFNDVVLPVLISLVGLTDGVHLMVQIRKLRSAGLEPLAAAKLGIRKVGLACALTSLTTAIGFASLGLAGHRFVQEFGFCCVIGVLLTFVSVVTTIPLACSTWLGKHVQTGQDKSLIDKNLAKIGGVVNLVLPRKKLVSYVAIFSTILFIGISLTLRPDERLSNMLPQGTEAAVTMAKLDTALGGIEQAGVVIRWSDLPEDSQEFVAVIGRVDEILASEPLIGHPLSVCDLIDSLPGEGPAEERLSMLEIVPPSITRNFYIPQDRWAHVSFRVQDLGIAAYDDTFKRVAAEIRELEAAHPAFSVTLVGEPIWRWKNLFQIVVDLATSLGIASLIIFAVLAIVYRSLRIGLISIIPNMFPLSVAGVYLVATGQSLEVVTVCAFTVCLGIAVDDTIHFLTMYQEERLETDDDLTAIRNAFTGVGTALIMTTIILVAGFSTVLLSQSRDHFVFASMAIITLSAALFADLIFLPALLAHYMPKSVGDEN